MRQTYPEDIVAFCRYLHNFVTGIDFSVSRFFLRYWEQDRNMESIVGGILEQLPQDVRIKLGNSELSKKIVLRTLCT